MRDTLLLQWSIFLCHSKCLLRKKKSTCKDAFIVAVTKLLPVVCKNKNSGPNVGRYVAGREGLRWGSWGGNRIKGVSAKNNRSTGFLLCQLRTWGCSSIRPVLQLDDELRRGTNLTRKKNRNSRWRRRMGGAWAALREGGVPTVADWVGWWYGRELYFLSRWAIVALVMQILYLKREMVLKGFDLVVWCFSPINQG